MARALVALVAVGAAALLGADAANAAPCDVATITWDGGAGTTAWGTANNWTGNRLPVSTDHVCIPDAAPGASVVFSTGTVSVLSLDARKPFTLSGGTLNLTSASQASQFTAGLALSGGTLGGAGARTLAGPLSWTAGAVGGNGLTTIVAGNTLSLTGSLTKNLNGPLDVAGTLKVNGSGPLSFSNAIAVVKNTGIIDLLGDTTLECCFGSGTPSIVNTATGVFRKTGGTESVVEIPLDNDGTVSATTGRIQLLNGTPTGALANGLYTSAAGASVRFINGTTNVDAAAHFAGAGTTILEGGVLSGPFSIDTGATMRWTGGTLRGGTGAANAKILAGATLKIEGANPKTLERRLRNDGTITVTGPFGFGVETVLTNASAIGFTAPVVVDCCFGADPHQILNLGSGVITSNGTAAAVTRIETPIDNDGVIRAVTGHVELTGGTGTAASATGTYAAAGAGSLDLTGGTFNVGAAMLSGGGTLLNDGATVSGPFVVAKDSTLTFRAGILRGPAAPATAVVKKGAALLADGELPKTFEGTIRNDGILRLDGYLAIGNNGQLTNVGTMSVVDDSLVDCCFGSGTRQIVNTATGVITKVGLADSQARLEMPLDNDGVVKSESGRLELNGGTPAGQASVGQFFAKAGTPVLAFIGGNHTFGAGGRLAGPGVVSVEGGNLTGPFTVKVGAQVSFTSGSLNGPASGATALFEAGSTVQVPNPDSKTITGLMRNEGTFRVGGYLAIGTAGVLTNVGTIDVANAAQVDCCFGSGSRQWINEPLGLIKKTGTAASTARLEVPLDNDGTVRAESGRLELHSGTGAGRASTGLYESVAGAPRVVFTAGTHTVEPGGRLAGPGVVGLEGGTLLGSFTVLDGATLEWSGGTLSGPPTTGTALIQPLARLEVATPDFKDLLGIVRNEGTVRVGGYMAFSTGAVLTNAANIEITDANKIECCFGSGTRQLLNLASGTITKTGTPSSVAVIEAPVDNDGVVRSDSGRLELSNGTGAGQASVGDYTSVAGGPTVAFTGGTHNVAPGAGTSGPGITTIDGGTVAGPLVVHGGSTLSFLDGSLYAPINGTGNILIEPAASVVISNPSFKTFRGPIRNEGRLHVDGYVAWDTLTDLTNVALLELDGAGEIDCCFGTGTRRIVNTPLGTVKTLGGATKIDTPFTNQGTVEVDAGSLALGDATNYNSDSGVLTGGAWHVKGQLGFDGSEGLTVNAADLTFDGPLAAVVDGGGADATTVFTKNTGTLGVLGRTLVLPAFTNTGAVALGPNGKLDVDSLVQTAGSIALHSTATLDASGGVKLAGGLLTGTGTIVGPLDNDGSAQPERLAPGGLLKLTGTYNQDPTGVFEVELSNTGTGTAQRQILATGAGVLGGTLRVSLSPTFVPIEGDVYTLGTFASRTGTFSTLDFEALTGGFFLEPFYNSTGFGVRVRRTPTV